MLKKRLTLAICSIPLSAGTCGFGGSNKFFLQGTRRTAPAAKPSRRRGVAPLPKAQRNLERGDDIAG